MHFRSIIDSEYLVALWDTHFFQQKSYQMMQVDTEHIIDALLDVSKFIFSGCQGNGADNRLDRKATFRIRRFHVAWNVMLLESWNNRDRRWTLRHTGIAYTLQATSVPIHLRKSTIHHAHFFLKQQSHRSEFSCPIISYLFSTKILTKTFFRNELEFALTMEDESLTWKKRIIRSTRTLC